MTGTRFHDLRHFFASQLIAQGETAAYVRDQMGHSSIKVTFNGLGISSQAAARKPVRATKSRWPMRKSPPTKRKGAVSNPLAIDREEEPEGTVTN